MSKTHARQRTTHPPTQRPGRDSTRAGAPSASSKLKAERIGGDAERQSARSPSADSPSAGSKLKAERIGGDAERQAGSPSAGSMSADESPAEPRTCSEDHAA